MPEKRLTIEGADPLMLFGFNDVYLHKIEAAFPDMQIAARGHEVRLNGEAKDVEAVERVLNEMEVILDRNDNLTESDVDTVLALFAGGDGTSSHEGSEDVILSTPGGRIAPKTPNQERLVGSAQENDLVFAIGPAGTGKTYISVALAVASLRAHQVQRIVLTRPAVEAGEELGFLPGDFREKVDPYLRPLYDALEDMLPSDELGAHLEQHVVEIAPLAYMRGRTLKSAFVILDEAQNATAQQMKMFLMRLGRHSRTIVTGDITQTDLPSRSHSGLVQVQDFLRDIEGLDFVYFDRNDVVRHRLVKDIIKAYDEFESR